MNEAEATAPVLGDEDLILALRDALDDKNAARIESLLAPLPRSDELRALLFLNASERDFLLSTISPEFAADLVAEAPQELAVDLVERLEPDTAVEIIDELGSDVQADVIGDLRTDSAEAILSQMDDEHAADVRRLANYEADTAGGLMQADVFHFRSDDTVGQVLRRFASDEEDFERYRGQHTYLLDDKDRPVGVVSLRALLTTKRSVSLGELMDPVITVDVTAGLEAVRDLFERHQFLGLPVVEEDGRIAGVLHRAAFDEALLEKAESSSLKRHGVSTDELRSMPLITRSRRRLAWLSANILLNIIAASVIAAYEDTLTAVIAVAIFLPMVSDMSGCSGNQAVAVTMRELSLGLVKPVDAFRVWLKEAGVGLINGTALGILIGLVVWIWKGNAVLGIVIGSALALNTLIAVSIGGVVPLVLKRMGQDPAVASGPLLTTITDMAGFFLVLSMAAAFMNHLV